MAVNQSILLITPPSEDEETNLPRWVERRRQKQQPLGLGIVGSQILHGMKGEVEVRILDFYSHVEATMNDAIAAICEECERSRVAIIGISCSSLLLRQAHTLGKLIRSETRLAGARLVLGGTATSYYHEEIQAWRLFDAIVVRNGNLAFLQYARHVIQGQPAPSEGVFMLADGRYEGSLPSEEFLAESVQSEVPVDYRLFRDRYGFEWEGGLAALFTAYGCPYNCAFCSEAESVRHYNCDREGGGRRLDVVRQEVESLKSLGYRRVSIVNDSLLNDASRWRDVVDILEENRLEFEVRARVDQLLAIGEEGVRLLVDKGLRRIFVGVESSSDESLSFLRKRITLAQTRKVFDYLAAGKRHHAEKGYGGEFSTVAYIMLGLKKTSASGGTEPESLWDVLKSIWLPFTLKADYAHYATLVLYPGTLLYKEWMREEGEADYWKRFYEDPSQKSSFPVYRYAIRRSIIVSAAYFLFYLRPRYWRVAIMDTLR